NAVYQAGMNLKIRDDHPDFPALVLGNYLFGGSADSRLWRRVREQEGLSYSVVSSLTASAFEARGDFKIFAIYAPQNRDRVEQAVDDEFTRVLKDGFTAEEVELAKAGYLEARRIARGQDKALAERLVNYLHRNRTLQWDIAFEKNIAALTPELILTALRRHFDMTRLTQVKAGDFANTLSAKSPQ
ncbi:MAG TPA: insulinase family protein, partial [Nitrosomonas sp.]|nr:insulinase family protein [Nitrosomonas sp.]